MKFEILVDDIKEGLQKVSKISSKNLSLPILSCVLITALEDYIELSSTNLELGVKVIIPAKIDKPGVVAVQADIISNIISQITTDQKILFDLKDKNIVIKSKLFEGTIHTVDHEDFPLIPEIKEKTGSLSIKSQNLTDLCKSVIYSGSVTSIKPELSSVLFYLDDDDNLVSVATDLFRLAEKKTKIISQQTFEKTLISIKNISEIIRIIGDVKTDVDIDVEHNQISFMFDNTYIISRTIDSNFPDYKQIIPKEYKTDVVVIKNDLLNTLKISKVFIDKLQHLKFTISPKDNIFTLSLKNSDIGDSVSQVPAKIEGESLEISFNFKYIIEVLGTIQTDSIRLEFNGVGKPVVIRGMGDNTFLYLVMPLIIKNNE